MPLHGTCDDENAELVLALGASISRVCRALTLRLGLGT